MKSRENVVRIVVIFVFFFKQKTAYEIKECDWSSDVCSSDLEKAEEPTEVGAVDGWSLNNGHGLTFIALFIFSVILYFRPYELIPALESFTSMAFFFGVLT